MKTKLTLCGLLMAVGLYGQTPCEDNNAAGFPCSGFDLMSRITPEEMNASFANDSWGWTDDETGNEYALVGLNNGTAFIDISDPVNPQYLGKLPTRTESSTWRDVKVYADHAFIVSEAPDHGMQVFDLTRLREISNAPMTFTEDAHYDGFGSAHNIVINTESGYAYAVGTALFNGGPVFINIQDPLNPIGEGGYAMGNYSHDAQVVTYSGPDADYTGREILIGSNADQIVIVDITDKNNPISIATTDYSNVGYTHQGWFTEDQRYFLLGDETDEFLVGFNTRTIIFDFTDLDNPLQFFEYFGTTPAVDHNGYVVGDTYYLANYEAGMRAIDISDISNQVMEEIGYFDTFPSSDQAGFGGTWNVYPFFESRNILITGDAGFTLVRNPDELSVPENQIAQLRLYPNPAADFVWIESSEEPLQQIEIFNVLGQQIRSMTVSDVDKARIPTNDLTSGLYLVRVNSTTTHRLIVK
jgi:choice-of-anchor B domain-containing protein